MRALTGRAMCGYDKRILYIICFTRQDRKALASGRVRIYFSAVTLLELSLDMTKGFFFRVKDFVNVVTYKGHRNFVSCVCWLPPCEAYPDGLVVTGSNDNTILGYNLQDGVIQVTLEGHENAVCSVTPGRDSGILLRLVFFVFIDK